MQMDIIILLLVQLEMAHIKLPQHLKLLHVEDYDDPELLLGQNTVEITAKVSDVSNNESDEVTINQTVVKEIDLFYHLSFRIMR